MRASVAVFAFLSLLAVVSLANSSSESGVSSDSSHASASSQQPRDATQNVAQNEGKKSSADDDEKKRLREELEALKRKLEEHERREREKQEEERKKSQPPTFAPLEAEILQYSRRAHVPTSWRTSQLSMSIRGGDLKYSFNWDHNLAYPITFDYVRPGQHKLFVWDSRSVWVDVFATVPDYKNSCPFVTRCAEMKDWNVGVYYVKCLYEIAAPMLWNPRYHVWDICVARAALELAHKLHINFDAYDVKEKDLGAMWVASYLVEALDICEKERGDVELCDFSWDYFSPIFWARQDLLQAIRERNFVNFRQRVLEASTELKDFEPTDVLLVGPFSFRNELVNAPLLASASKAKVVTLTSQTGIFNSSLVRTAVLPFTLQANVNLATIFLRDFMKMMKPKWIFGTDSAGILILSRLSLLVNRPSMWELRETFLRSWTQPFTYLDLSSKLIPGHEPFAPKELIVSEDDGSRLVCLDLKNLSDVIQEHFNGFAVMKREFSEDSRGVTFVRSGTDLFPAVNTLLTRLVGTLFMDLDIRVRLFLQKPILGMEPLGVRALSYKGKVISMAVSRVKRRTTKVALMYETVRDKGVEDRAVEFFKAVNYTGFGSAWFLPVKNESYFLFDFNARVERHACLGVLKPEDRHLDPCFALQLLLHNKPLPEEPLVVPAGYEYNDPLRLGLLEKKERQDDLLVKRHLWNAAQDDERLIKEHVEPLLSQVDASSNGGMKE